MVLSDLHIHQKRREGSFLKADHRAVIASVIASNPDALLLLGDLTSGDRNLRHSKRTVAAWWEELLMLLEPLRAAKIPVLMVPGNHDTYQERQLEGYRAAFDDLQSWAGRAEILPGGDPPFYYAAKLSGLRLLLLDASHRTLGAAQEAWLAGALEDADRALVAGHRPLFSLIYGRADRRMMKSLGAALEGHQVEAYLCGHEHLLWDQFISLPNGTPLRQIMVGSAGSGYTYAPAASLRAHYCEKGTCSLPGSSAEVEVNQQGEQRDPTAWVEVRIPCDGPIEVIPWELGGERDLR